MLGPRLAPAHCYNLQMTRPDSASPRAEYARRMTRVLNYIDQHLDQPLELADLADVANFSRFHFHRIFHAWMGETLGDYARRRRLEKAAFRLSCSSTETVLATALATGFASGEAFARAFKLKFGCTPSAWRRDTRKRLAAQALRLPAPLESNPDQAVSNFDQADRPGSEHHDGSPIPTGEAHMEVNVIDLPPARVAYLRRIGAYGLGIGDFWRGTVAPWMRSHGLDNALCYGVGYDDPSITPADKCRYDACIAIPDTLTEVGAADIATLPGGRYARARFVGMPADIAQAWTWLTRNWLPSSGLQCDDRPCFEMCSPATARNPDTGELSCDICIPVRPL